jgi:DNA invertase Pin-like site-specific DNA recombinase
MVRTYRRKTTPVDKEQLKKAVLAVRKDKMSTYAAAKQFDVRRTTLNDWLKKNNDEIENLDNVVVHKGHFSVST